MNNNIEKNLFIANKTEEALEDNTNTLKALEILSFSQSVFSSPLKYQATRDLVDAKGETFIVSNDVIEIVAETLFQKNKQLQLIPIDANLSNFRTNCTNLSNRNCIKVKDNYYNFSKDFTVIVTIKDLTESDIKKDENKIN